VLLVEAGGPDRNPAIHDPARMHELWHSEEDWAYQTVPQRHAADRQLHWPRGRVVGGSSSLNGMIFVRGARADWDGWAALGNDGWSWQEVLPAFRAMEDYDGGASELRGAGGPVSVTGGYRPSPVHEAILAAAESVGIPRNPDYNSGELDGVAPMQFTLKDGRRHSAAGAYLEPVREDPNLRIATRARVRRLLFDGGRCTGVELQRDGRVERERAGAGVILSAGTIVSPQLLMLSGIGPADELRAHGLDVLVDLPGVGRNLHDHLLSPTIHAAEREIGPPAAGLPHLQTHFWWRSRPGLPAPDTQPLAFSVPLYEPWMKGPPNAFTILAGLVRPASRGSIRLGGPAPEDPLLIDPAALSEPEDLTALEASLEQVRELAAAAPLAEWGVRELYPGAAVRSAGGVRDYIRRTAISYHHQVGTCRMGIDPGAVVDPRLRLRGIDGLWVADASVMPAVTSGNTHAPSMLIGERVAEFVARDALASSGSSAAAG
jgi:choline dehydrogenase-like flavoprotein